MTGLFHRKEGKAILSLLSILLLCGCVGQNTPRQSGQPETTTLETEDGYNLAGTFYPAEGDTAVVLAHMGGLDQSTWSDFAGLISEKGFPTLTFDFRCHGKSECNASLHSLHLKDMRSAFRFLHERGYKKIVCMGASLGAVACMNISLEEELVGLVIIGSPMPEGNFPEDLVSPSMPKLFIGTEKDRYTPAIAGIPLLYRLSPEPKEIKIFSGTAHGTDLFFSEYSDEFQELLTTFLESIRAPAPSGTLMKVSQSHPIHNL